MRDKIIEILYENTYGADSTDFNRREIMVDEFESIADEILALNK